MAQRYKIDGLVTIPAPLMGSEDLVMDSPEFEVMQCRMVNNIVYTGITYYVMQGSIENPIFVEYPKAMEDLTQDESDVVQALITQGTISALAMPEHEGSYEI